MSKVWLYAKNWAKGVLADPAAHTAYLAKAKQLCSTRMAVVVKDWMVSPQVTTLDLSAYNKHVGDVISIAAQDDFEVTGVTVAIEDSTHMVVENGAAVYDAARPVKYGGGSVGMSRAVLFHGASGSWKYTATVDASAKPSVTVTATASDRPGNTGMLAATK